MFKIRFNIISSMFSRIFVDRYLIYIYINHKIIIYSKNLLLSLILQHPSLTIIMTSHRANLSSGGSLTSLAKYIFAGSRTSLDADIDEVFSLPQQATPTSANSAQPLCVNSTKLIVGSPSTSTQPSKLSPLNTLWNTLKLKQPRGSGDDAPDSAHSSTSSPPTRRNLSNIHTGGGIAGSHMFKFVCNRDLNSWAPSST